MSNSKNHHYVPQFYLRLFSADKKSISLLNKKRNKIIKGAPIKGQCALENFHGWHEDVEHNIAEIEGDSAPVIQRIAVTGSLPRTGSADHLRLSLFVALQMGRTQSIAKENDAMTDRFVKKMMEGDPALRGVNLDRFKVGDKYPIALPIVTFLRAYDRLFDLNCLVLVASTKAKFVTSDNPVVRYNSLRRHVWWEGVTGLECEGLQLFLPLSPHHMLYMYDGKFYKSPNFDGPVRLTVEETTKSTLSLF